MKLPKELKKKQKQTQEIKTKKSTRKKRKQYTAKPKNTEYAVRPKKKFTETFAPYAIIIAVVFVVIIVVVATTLDNSNNSNPYETNLTFQTISGGTIKLADHQGEIVLLFFFDLVCTPCSPESDIISNIDDDYSDNQLYIVFITVHCDDSNDGLNQFKNDHNLNRPIVRDDCSGSYSATFNIAYTPTTILLDRDGAEVQRFIGYDVNHYNQIENAINSL